MMDGVTIVSARILLPVVITLIAPLFVWLCRKDENRREAISFVAAALTFGSMVSMAPAILRGEVWYYHVTTILPGISIAFAADGLSMIFGLIAPFLWFFVTSYNIGYMRGLNEHAQTRYYVCFAVAIFGAVGVALSANVFTLYLFYEIITVFTYPLVYHHEDADAKSGARKYIVYLMGTSKLFLLPAMVLTYVLVGNLDFHLSDIVNGMFSAQVVAEHPRLVALTYWLYIFGIGKAALMPFHNWLPSAMVAPTPVSALLHAVAVVKAGVFCVCRIVLSAFGTKTAGFLTLSQIYVGSPGTFLGDISLGIGTAYIAAFTLVVASLIALTKDDIKARLAYSTVAQLSYVVVGLAVDPGARESHGERPAGAATRGGHPFGHDPAQGHGGPAAGGQGGGGGRQPRQVRVPGQHEPRDPHAPEWHHGHAAAPAAHVPGRKTGPATRRWPCSLRAVCCTCCRISWTSRGWRRASSACSTSPSCSARSSARSASCWAPRRTRRA